MERPDSQETDRSSAIRNRTRVWEGRKETCGPRWKSGVVKRQRGPVSYEIEQESRDGGKATCGLRWKSGEVKRRTGPVSYEDH